MKIKVIFMFGLLSIALQIMPMRVSRIGQFMNQYSHKVIPYSLYAGTVSYIGFEVFQALFFEAFLKEGYEIQMSPDHSKNELDTIRPFIEKEIKKTGLNSDDIKIMLAPLAFGWSVVSNKYLLIDKQHCDEAQLLGSFKEVSSSSNEVELKRKEVLAVLHHELGHIKANDNQRVTAQRCLVGGTSIATLAALCARTLSKKNQAAFVIGAGLPLYAINNIVNHAYSRHREALADENIPNKREYLEGCIRYFEHILAHYKDVNGFRYYWHSTHPSTQSRIDRSKERLAFLEKNKTNKT